MQRFAILSVFDKTGLAELAKGLTELGVEILSTGGTAKFLESSGYKVVKISDHTGHPEILEGRVKSLHPKIHGGILARRELAEDLAELAANKIAPIDFVIVNLYAFNQKLEEVVAKGLEDSSELLEMIDIGGPTMIRAAAKNCYNVVPVCDPADYPTVLAELKATGDVSRETREKLAAKVFTMTAAYDGQIAAYFSSKGKLQSKSELPELESLVLKKKMELRYGENPHQSAALYSRHQEGVKVPSQGWVQLQGKELSYNNLLDMQAAVDLFLELSTEFSDKNAAVVIKHLNPCGAALSTNSNKDAFVLARNCDPVSAFGGIVALSGEVGKDLAETILEGFVEVLLLEEISNEAKEVFAKKKNIRVIKCDFDYLATVNQSQQFNIRPFYHDYLLQTPDKQLSSLSKENVVCGETVSSEQLEDFKLAWVLCKHVKSNAIVIAKNRQAIGIGAGQMSRVDSAKLSIERAKANGHDVKGGVAASDAFLPFADTLTVLNDAGVVGLVQPGGSIKDDLVVEEAKKRNVSMLFTGERHFRH